MKVKTRRFKDNDSFFKFVNKYKDKINIRSVSISKRAIIVKYE